jgi:hypothetical protein
MAKIVRLDSSACTWDIIFLFIQRFECVLSKCSIKARHSIVALGLKDMQSLIGKKNHPCHHYRIREIGQDYDKDGNTLRLIRCQRCGLLMREYLSMLHP